jgi:hypothetical protein
MLSSISRAPRFSVTTCILIAAGVSLLLVLFAYFSDSLKAPLEYAHGKAGEYWDKTFKYAPAPCDSAGYTDVNGPRVVTTWHYLGSALTITDPPHRCTTARTLIADQATSISRLI